MRKTLQKKNIIILCLLIVFIFMIGYFLSFFNKNKLLTNIKIGDLAFNLTTNGDQSDKRIIHLQAEKTESFNIKITNLNKVDTKYELIYDICTDSKCDSKLDKLPENIDIGLSNSSINEVSGTITKNNYVSINILAKNNTNKDYYIKLNLNADYIWNDLVLTNQFNKSNTLPQILAYVDGVEIAKYPSTCNFVATITGYKNNQEIALTDASALCNESTNEWKISYIGYADKIKIKFKYAPYLNDYITKLDQTENGLEIDETADKNLRYVGATPKNYLSFNDEIWRIIGIFDVYNTESGKTESLVKIIRNDYFSTTFSWDTSASGVNSGKGINEWSQAKIKTELNEDYINTNITTGITKWYNGSKNVKNGTYNYSNNIKSTAINKIATVRWNLGSHNQREVSAVDMYNYERGTNTISSPADNIKRTTTWDGKIALLYPSDYGFASTNSSCRASLYDSSYNCKNNNWLFNSKTQWLLTPYSSEAYNAYLISSAGYINGATIYNTYYIRPVLFLKSTVMVSGGTGADADNAYTIATNY